MAGTAISRAPELGLFEDGNPGPGLLTFFLGIALALLTMVWLVQSVLRRRVTSSDSESAEPSRFPDRAALARIGSVVAAQVAFVVTLPLLGFRLTSVAFLLFLSYVIGEQRLRIAIPVAILFSFGSYHAFVAWLEVPLPTSPLLSWL